MRLIETTVGPKGIVKTYRNAQTKEYVCKLEGNPAATYYTDDKADALMTALCMAHGRGMAVM